MSNSVEITVPDIGDFEDVDVIEILVAVGDTVAPEDPLVTLESEKATMDIPSPSAGVIESIAVAVNDKVSEGSLLVTITANDDAEKGSEAESRAGSASESPAATTTEPVSGSAASDADEDASNGTREASGAADRETAADAPNESVDTTQATAATSTDKPAASKTLDVKVPDIGDFDNVDVIEILVQPGDVVSVEDPLLTLESEKATMDIPAPSGGTVERILVSLGDKVSEGDVIVRITTASEKSDAPAASPPPSAAPAEPIGSNDTPREQQPRPAAEPEEADTTGARASGGARPYAGPGVRKFARELGVDIAAVTGSGRKGRITKPDVKAFVKKNMAAGPRDGIGIPAVPDIDFSKFGPVETLELNKIRRLTGQNLHRSWVVAPHVTQFDDADITELEAFRKARLDEAKDAGVKLTLLAFIVKAVVDALQRFPDFNASLSADGNSLIRKQYFHIGIAVNTEHGLVVPVLRDADRKGVYAIATELADLSTRARERKLSPSDMQGGCFTITSLGGVGGTAFTPIINVPEVAILGISTAAMKPVYTNDEFVPRLMLPLSLSYDHRVIDGVAGAQFIVRLREVLGDIRALLL